jgi:hypothetical protein
MKAKLNTKKLIVGAVHPIAQLRTGVASIHDDT